MEFAREVAETKAMDDALNRLEGMFTGTDPREEGMAPRRGDNVSKSGSFGPSTTSSSTGEVCGTWKSQSSPNVHSNIYYACFRIPIFFLESI